MVSDFCFLFLPLTPSPWYLRGAIFLVVAYVLCSQALADLPGWSFLGAATAALLAGLLAFGQLARAWRLRLGRWVWLPVAFIAYCLLRSFSGIKDTDPFGVLISVASAFLGGIAVALAIRTGVRFRWLVYAQVASNLLQILIVCFGLGSEPTPGEDSFRYAGMTGNANALAMQLTLGACLIWLLPKKAGVLPCVFAFGSVIFALAVTGSRKAVLVAGFFLVLVAIQSFSFLPRKRIRRRRWLILACAVPCLLGLILVPIVYYYGQDLLAIRRVMDYDDSSYETRAQMIQQGIDLWLKSPIFGNGLDSFRSLSGQDTYSHNNYVELLCGLGLVGTLLFYAIYVNVVIRAARARPVLKYYSWVFILMLLLADIGYVSYKSKQSIMILMVLTALATSRYALKQHRRAAARRASALKPPKPRLRRFVMGT